MKISKLAVGNVIENRRRQLDFTQQGLADKMCGGYENLEDSANIQRKISSWENGISFPKMDDLMNLCEALDCDPQYLWGEIDTPRKETRTIIDITGLSERAVDTLIGISQFGPTKTQYALEKLLEHEDTWKFLAHKSEIVCDKNVLTSIGDYISISSEGSDKFMVSDGAHQISLSGADYIKSLKNNGMYAVKPLIERTQLDSILDALKDIKKAASGD